MTLLNVQIIDNLLFQFCQTFERLYGSDKVTPNMHMHCHLADYIRDFGPIYSFLQFFFKRYNGLLGSVPTNKKNIEVQLMRRFDRDLHVLNLPYLDELREFIMLFKSLFPSKENRGTLSDCFSENNSVVSSWNLSSWKTDVSNGIKWYKIDAIQLKREIEYKSLSEMYSFLYPNNDIFVNRTCWKTSEVNYRNETYGSGISRSKRSSYVMAY